MTMVCTLQIRHFDWRPALVITGGIVFSCFIFSCFFRPLKDEEEEEEEDENVRYPNIVEPGTVKAVK